MYVKRLLVLLACGLILPAAAGAETLRYSAVSSWNMPYGKFDGDQLVDGIMYDLAQAIAKQLQIPVTFVVLPRKRVDTAAMGGDIDLRCYLTPQWTEVPDQYVWSGKLFEVTDVIFGAAGSPPLLNVDAIPRGTIVSTVLGYGYSTLAPYFASGHLKREDTVDQEKVNLKMTAGRTPYGLSETEALNWYQRLTPMHRHSDWRLVVSRNDFQCGIPKKGAIAAPRILKALESMKKSNQFEEILRKYR
jgi:polar amino acid transport system substrate-binding protein